MHCGSRSMSSVREAGLGQAGGHIDRGRRLAHAALLVGDGDDARHGASRRPAGALRDGTRDVAQGRRSSRPSSYRPPRERRYSGDGARRPRQAARRERPVWLSTARRHMTRRACRGRRGKRRRRRRDLFEHDADRVGQRRARQGRPCGPGEAAGYGRRPRPRPPRASAARRGLADQQRRRRCASSGAASSTTTASGPTALASTTAERLAARGARPPRSSSLRAQATSTRSPRPSRGHRLAQEDAFLADGLDQREPHCRQRQGQRHAGHAAAGCPGRPRARRPGRAAAAARRRRATPERRRSSSRRPSRNRARR